MNKAGLFPVRFPRGENEHQTEVDFAPAVVGDRAGGRQPVGDRLAVGGAPVPLHREPGADKITEIKSGLDAAAGAALEQAAVFSRMPEVLAAYELAHSGDIGNEADPQVQQAREGLRASLRPHLDGFAAVLGGRKLQIHFHLSNSTCVAHLHLQQQLVLL